MGAAYNSGDYDLGAIYKFDPVTNNYSRRYSFQGTNGENPQGGIVQASNGKLYGLTKTGGAYNKGVLYEFNPANDTFTKKMDFNGSNGNWPEAGLFAASNGKLYGMTHIGGAYNNGVFFEYDPISNEYYKILDFNYGSDGFGANPLGNVMEASDGKIYGMSRFGGAYGGNMNGGVIFEYNPSSKGIKRLYSFGGISNDGSNIYGHLTQAENGKLYGMTSWGGLYDDGTLFEFNITTGVYTKKYDFKKESSGYRPYGSLELANNNKLYGMISDDNFNGSYSTAILFEYDPISAILAKTWEFSSEEYGRGSNNTLLLASDGMLYVGSNGGAYGNGMIIKYSPNNSSFTKLVDVGANDALPNSHFIEIEDYDNDDDGVINYEDLCSNTPTGETVNATGCSDSQLDDDSDSVMNNIDTCPNTPNGEEVNATGCSQSQIDDDLDGVMNDVDACPDTPTGEDVNSTGCSQSQIDDDSDGVMNDIDTCPDTPNGEEVDETGCSQSQIDDDYDGVMNNIDTCPNTPNGEEVNETGCLVIKKCKSYDSIDTPINIPDNNDKGVNSVINVLEEFDNFSDIYIKINITHPWVGDLTLSLVNPNGKKIYLAANIGDDGTNYFNTIFNNNSNTSISSGTPPFSGTYLPIGNLEELFDGIAKGEWVLNVMDGGPEDIGVIESWNIEFCSILIYNNDDDSDGIINGLDNCYFISNPDQNDIDNDGIGDICDSDRDGDGIFNDDDFCPDFASDNQNDIDGDGIGDVCDPDRDGDGVLNENDNCLNTPSGETVDANGCILLAADNFTIEVISETCPNKNNGQLIISANENRDYKLTINGEKQSFTAEKTLSELSPGSYEICIEVEGVTSPYCYSVVVEEGTTISGKSSLNNKQLRVEVLDGTLPYKVFVNGKLLFETLDNEFSLEVDHGDTIEVKTLVKCEGVYSKKIQLFDKLTVYPNPSDGLFTIALPTNDKQVTISVFNDISQLMVSNTYEVINSRIQLDLTDKPVGVYLVKVYLDKEYVFKVVKK